MIEETVILIQIIFLDLVMAADNAIIIGMVAANFAPQSRKKIIMWGIFAAFIFRIIFAFSATFLFQFAYIKLIGGAKSPTKKSKEPSFASGVYKVLIADITLSFDNVLGVAGAAKEHYMLLFFGLFLSVVFIAAGASYFAEYIQKHQWVGYVGLVVILLIAIQLIIGGLIGYDVLTINEPFASWF